MHLEHRNRNTDYRLDNLRGTVIDVFLNPETGHLIGLFEAKPNTLACRCGNAPIVFIYWEERGGKTFASGFCNNCSPQKPLQQMSIGYGLLSPIISIFA